MSLPAARGGAGSDRRAALGVLEAQRLTPDWWSALVDRYLADLVVRGRSANTRTNYAWSLRKHVGPLLDGLCGPEAITRSDVLAWQREIAEHAALNPKSRELVHAALRGLLKWAAGEEIVPDSLHHQVRSIKVSDSLPRPLPDHELALVKDHFAQPRPGETPWMRDRALFWFLYTTASRIDAALKLNRAEFRDRRARIIQKGNREHELVSTEFAQRAALEYLAERQDQEPALFVSHQRGRPARRLTPAGANVIWARVALDLGIHRFTNHQLRHSGITDLYEATGDLLLASRQAGHASVSTTAGYARLSRDRRLHALDALEPKIIELPAGRPRLLPSLKPRRRR